MHRHFCASSFQVGAHTSAQGMIGVKSGFFTQRHFLASSVVSNGQNRAHGGAAVEGLADITHTPSATANNAIERLRNVLANIFRLLPMVPKVASLGSLSWLRK
jgi:hypothetical protein